jgi:hypothetical protein
MSTQEAPKVFISHASEDKERFVVDFASNLRQRGIDAWVDQWEIRPGDSLVKKIFDEGLNNAEAVIIVLSNISIQKPWVREELDISIVKKITEQIRVIPIIIDADCIVPASLQSTLWVKIQDLKQYDQELTRIVNTIFNISDKPPLGQPPRHIQLEVDQLPGLSSIDTQIFKAICDTALGEECPMVNMRQFNEIVQDLQISEQDLHDSLHILHNRHLIDAKWSHGPSLMFINLTQRGFENYGKFYISDFDTLLNRAMVIIANETSSTHSNVTNGVISDKLNINSAIGMFLLEILSSRKYIQLLKVMGDNRSAFIVHAVTAEGRRFAARIA